MAVAFVAFRVSILYHSALSVDSLVQFARSENNLVVYAVAHAGSHAGHIRLPQEWGDMSNPNNVDAEWLYKVPASAGDAIVFTEAITHGAIPWTQQDSNRRTLFYK